jgi:hypothetical protein
LFALSSFAEMTEKKITSNFIFGNPFAAVAAVKMEMVLSIFNCKTLVG